MLFLFILRIKRDIFSKTSHAKDILGQIIFNDCKQNINFIDEVYISKYLLVGKINIKRI